MLATPALFIYGAFCILSYAAFAFFYSSEDSYSPRSIVTALITFVLASLVTLYIGVVAGGALAIAATFYVVDRKNRSRGWAFLAFLFGPLIVLITVCLPKLAPTTLSLSESRTIAPGGAKKSS